MNKPWKISRRKMLQGLGASIALPALDVMAPVKASATAAASSARRLAYFYFPNGIPRGTWEPAKVGVGGKLLQLNDWMSPLEPYKQYLTIPSNLMTPLGNGHGAGTATWLTGGDYDDQRVTAGGASVDQLVASHVGQQTLLPSLELSLRGEGFFSNSLPRNILSWNEKGMPMAREMEPRVVFDRMFSTSSAGVGDRSVLDLVLDEARSLQKQVSSVDRLRLDEYFESINALEKRIAFAERQSLEAGNDRARTDTLTAPSPGIPTKHEEYVRQMMDLLVLAFQSDATRVCTFMLDHGQSNRYFDFIDSVRGTWHALSHYKDASGMTEDDDGTTSWDSVEQKRAMFAEVVRWHHRQMAYLLGRLKAIQEPDGRSLLDNSMLVYGSSLSDGNEHGEENLPLIVAGNGGGTIESGRYLEFEHETDMSRLHLALAQRMGVATKRFGKADSPLDRLDG